MKNYFEALSLVFKPLGVYCGKIVETKPYVVEFDNGGKGNLECSKDLALQQNVEVIVAGLWDDGLPFLSLTADCCNKLKVNTELIKCTVVAVSNVGIIATYDDEYVYYTPLDLAYEYKQLKPGDCINCLISSAFPDRILQILEVCTKEDDNSKYNGNLLEDYGFDEDVYNEAKEYASLDIRNNLKLGYCYEGLVINNYAKIGNILTDLRSDKEINCQTNVVLKVVNIPPSPKRRIEVEIVE